MMFNSIGLVQKSLAEYVVCVRGPTGRSLRYRALYRFSSARTQGRLERFCTASGRVSGRSHSSARTRTSRRQSVSTI